jgi:hypothetical protein
LRELQKAVKDPISNFGVVLGEVTKRGRSVVGLGGANELANHVHPNLIETSAVLCKNVELFGGAVEKVLIKHGKFTSNCVVLLFFSPNNSMPNNAKMFFNLLGFTAPFRMRYNLRASFSV